jgi:hypothetical protein
MNEIKKFDIAGHTKAGFRAWAEDQFPNLKEYADRKMATYSQFVDRIPEIYATTTLVLETVASHSDAEDSELYLTLERKFERAFISITGQQMETRDWSVLANCLDEIVNSMGRTN